MSKDLGALTGSREPSRKSVSALTGFDPERVWVWLTEPVNPLDCRIIGFSAAAAAAFTVALLVLA